MAGGALAKHFGSGAVFAACGALILFWLWLTRALQVPRRQAPSHTAT